MNQNLHTSHDTRTRTRTHTNTNTTRRGPCKSILLAGLQFVDQLPALAQCQLELAQVALDSFFALLHGAEQGVESVRFRSEGLFVVLKAASRKAC